LVAETGMEARGEAARGEEALTFEAAMERLERIVEELEKGDVPLEQAIELFQEGMRLSRWCGEKLEQAEQKIEMLLEENGSIARKPFIPAADEGKGE